MKKPAREANMRPWYSSASLVIPVLGAISFALIQTGCSSAGNAGNLRRESNPPVVQSVSWTPADQTLKRYVPYTFSVVAVDPDIGDAVVGYEWDFGDGSAAVTTTVPTVVKAFTQSSSEGLTVRVRARDRAGNVGAWFQGRVAVDNANSPLVVTQIQPTVEPTFSADAGGFMEVTYVVRVVDASPGVGTPGGPTINLSAALFDPGDVGATVLSRRDNLDGTYAFTVKYLAGSTLGSRTITPRVQMFNSINIASDVLELSKFTILTKDPATNVAPVLAITAPASPVSDAYTSQPVQLALTISDADADTVQYRVNWGDGSPVQEGLAIGDTKAGVSLTLPHVFRDTFTATSANAVVTVTATDFRNNGAAVPQSRTYRVAYNALPTGTIVAPQASLTPPSAEDLPSGSLPGLVNPPGATNPDIVVIPYGAGLVFKGLATPPTSMTGSLSYEWTFPGGIPNASTQLEPGTVIFPGENGKVVAYLVTFRVRDPYGRTSTDASPNPKTYQKWVVVDGKNYQTFKLGFLYRQKNNVTGNPTLTPVEKATNGLGASVEIFQDGMNSRWSVADAVGKKALAEIPVRSNLDFYLKVPKGIAGDERSYVLRIPNAPNGAYADPSLHTFGSGGLIPTAGNLYDPNAKGISWFGFESASLPWNPTLRLVTAEGFTPETVSGVERRIQGGTSLVIGDDPENERWIDRLSMPSSDEFNVHPWVQSNNLVGGFQDIRGYQEQAEWLTLLLTLKTGDILPVEQVGGEDAPDPTGTAGKPEDMGFVLDYPKYTEDNAESETFSAFYMQAWRVPPYTRDPYDLSSGTSGDNWNNTITALNPVAFTPEVLSSKLQEWIYGPVGSTPLSGGLQGLTIPYDSNASGWPLLPEPFTRNFSGIRKTFSYSEYLWSNTWARPLVLNSARLDYTTPIATFPYFRSSRPGTWPSAVYSPTSGADVAGFDMTPASGGSFSGAGTGRFYWLAFSPFYGGTSDAMVSRTFLSAPGGDFPTTFAGSPAGDATTAVGFLPPQDPGVDKRLVGDCGGLVPNTVGGYRVGWFNATRDAAGAIVSPDFWVLEFNRSDGEVFHYVVPTSYNATNPKLSDPLVTDLTKTLTNPCSGKLEAAPGMCWVDLPKELRADILKPGESQVLRIYAVKAILKNNPPALARPLNRLDWIEAIKTVTANVLVKGGNSDMSYAHKIPFNYCWDIVVVNSASTWVAP